MCLEFSSVYLLKSGVIFFNSVSALTFVSNANEIRIFYSCFSMNIHLFIFE